MPQFLYYKKKLRYYFLCVFLTLILFPATNYSETFVKQISLSKLELLLLFPKHKLDTISRAAAVKLHPKFRHENWPMKIPFGGFVSHKDNKAYYFVYESTFKNKFIEIQHPDLKSPFDISFDEMGHIFITDNKSNYLFAFQLKNDLSEAVYLSKIKIEEPLKCETDGKKNIAVLNNNGDIKTFVLQRNNLMNTKTLRKRLEKILNTNKVVEVAYDSNRNLIVATHKFLYKFSQQGSLEKQTKVNYKLDHIQVTLEDDIIVVSNQNKEIYKYNKDLRELDKVNISQRFKKDIKDFILYKPFGYIGLFNEENAVYYGLGVNLKDGEIIRRKSISGKKYFDIAFVSTFKSQVSIQILDENKEVVEGVVNNKSMPADFNQVFWDGIGDKNQYVSQGFVEIEAKADYSAVNTKKLLIPFKI